MGIHGEPGLEQCGMRSADELAQAMVDAILRYHTSRHAGGAIGLRCPGLSRVGGGVLLTCGVCGRVVRSGYLSVGPQQRVVILLNNLGATPPIEVTPSKPAIPSIVALAVMTSWD